jgi:hypothetical protein
MLRLESANPPRRHRDSGLVAALARAAAPFLAVAALGTPRAMAFGPDPTAESALFRFVVFNDAHLTVADLAGSRADLRAAVDEINGFHSQIAFVFVDGDLGQSEGPTGLRAELEAAKGELDRLAVPYHVALGNHDVTTGGDDSAFRSLFGRTSYRFSYGGMQFIDLCTTMTTTSTVLTFAALDSLSANLSQISVTDPLVVFGHHPLGQVTPYAVTNRGEFYSRVDPYNLKAVFNGHFHGLSEEQRNGVWYCTTRAISQHRCNHDGSTERGYRLVSVWPDRSVSSSFYALGTPPTFLPSAPTFRAVGNRYALPGRMLRLQLAARTLDGDGLAYSASGLPAGASFDPATRLFTWTPGGTQKGFFSGMRFRAANSTGADTLRLGVRVLDQACLFDDFEPGQPGWTAAGGAWGVQNGELTQQLPSGGPYFYTRGSSWTDLYMEADVLEVEGIGYPGIVFRYQDPGNYYYLWNNSLQVEVRKRVNGVATRISDSTPSGGAAGWHHVRVEAIGTHLKVYWDGAQQAEADDATFAAGDVGLVCSQVAARFDNVVVAGCQGLYDRAPILTSIGNRTVFVGAPVQIDVAASDADAQPLTYSASGLPRGATWNKSLRRFAWTPAALDLGIWHGTTFRVTDGELEDAENVTFTVLDTTRACLFESFSDPASSSKWSPSGGTWSVANGTYVGTTGATAALSTYGPAGLQNFTYAARVRVTGQGYGNLAFRIVDSTHYYFLSTSTVNNTVELRKVVGSTVTTLVGGGDVGGPVQNTWHQYQVQTENDIIRVWVDGERRFEYRDTGTSSSPAYFAGRIGARVLNATLELDDAIAYDCGATTIDASLPAVPERLGLSASPNPFNPRTTVSFEIAHASPVRVAVFDASGRSVRRLFDGALPPGLHHLAWEGVDDSGRAVSSGVYYLYVRAGALAETRSLVLVK